MYSVASEEYRAESTEYEVLVWTRALNARSEASLSEASLSEASSSAGLRNSFSNSFSISFSIIRSAPWKHFSTPRGFGAGIFEHFSTSRGFGASIFERFSTSGGFGASIFERFSTSGGFGASFFEHFRRLEAPERGFSRFLEASSSGPACKVPTAPIGHCEIFV